MIYLLLKNSVRKNIRSILNNKIYFIFATIATLFALYWVGGVSYLVIINYFMYAKVIVCVYEVIKIVQKLPTINAPIRLIQYRIISHWQYKAYIVFKSSGASIAVIITFSLISAVLGSNEIIEDVIILSLLNYVINLLCFIKTQTRYSMITTIICCIIIIHVLLFESVVIISAITVLASILFLLIKQIKLDQLFIYYHFMNSVGTGLSNRDSKQITESQKFMSFMSKNLFKDYLTNHYGIHYGIHKEVKRVINNYSMILNSLIITMVSVIIAKYFIIFDIVYSVVFLVAMIAADSLLSNLNKSESQLVKEGMFLPYSIVEWVKQKYFVQLISIAIILIPIVCIIPNVGVVQFLLVLLILPIKSILQYFKIDKIHNKVLNYFIQLLLFSLCFLQYSLLSIGIFV